MIKCSNNAKLAMINPLQVGSSLFYSLGIGFFKAIRNHYLTRAPVGDMES